MCWPQNSNGAIAYECPSLLAPDRFIGTAEDSGTIVLVTDSFSGTTEDSGMKLKCVEDGGSPS